jgi:hypothetical protein
MSSSIVLMKPRTEKYEPSKANSRGLPKGRAASLYGFWHPVICGVRSLKTLSHPKWKATLYYSVICVGSVRDGSNEHQIAA